MQIILILELARIDCKIAIFNKLDKVDDKMESIKKKNRIEIPKLKSKI